MSHAYGQVKFKDGTILHFEYDGTSDIVCNCLYNSSQEVFEHWKAQPSNTCTCSNNGEPVEVATDYGGGIKWEGRACKKCRAIIQNLGPGAFDNGYYNFEDSLPDWWIDSEDESIGYIFGMKFEIEEEKEGGA